MRVLVVCARRYNGHELWTALGVLQEAGIEFEVISTANIIADEITRRPNRIERTIKEVDPSEVATFDGLMIISGNMSDTELYWHDKRVLAYVHEANTNGLAIAAICCSVPTIREAAKGKKVSFFPLIRSKAILEDAGAIPSSISITVDGRLVTAEHQMASQVWAGAFAKILAGEDPDLRLLDSGYVPTGKTERRLHPRLERLRGSEYHPKNRAKMIERGLLEDK